MQRAAASRERPLPESVTVTDNRSGESIEIPIVDGGIDAAEWRKLLPGLWVFDPGYTTTAAAASEISGFEALIAQLPLFAP